MWHVEASEWQVEAGDRYVEVGERQVEAGERQVEAGVRQVEAGEVVLGWGSLLPSGVLRSQGCPPQSLSHLLGGKQTITMETHRRVFYYYYYCCYCYLATGLPAPSLLPGVAETTCLSEGCESSPPPVVLARPSKLRLPSCTTDDLIPVQYTK